MQLILKPYNLKLKHTFTISRQSFKEKPTLIVELQHNNFSGLGESSSNPYYNITISNMVSDLESVRDIIETTELAKTTPQVFWQKMHPFFKHDMFALSALDIAYNDLYAQLKAIKLYDLWKLDISHNPLTNFTIGIDSVEKMVRKMQETVWPIYKIKLGTKDDIKIITELRKHTNAIFRVDANCGWTVDETLKNAFSLKKLGVEFIEQPLKADEWDDHKKVFNESELPIIADESCLIESDVVKCHQHFHGINIKLVKCGGLTPAKRMISEAKILNMKTMVGCMTESSVGISAIAHLLPLLDYVDMDGALLLEKDIAKGVNIVNGVTHYRNCNGIGSELY
jgi:L-alanine-DL-glutamate epimerase-like enolase superfamily enzyme